MTEGWQPDVPEAPLDEAPTWLRALQAGIVGIVAGLVLYAILSLAVLQAGGSLPAHAEPKECRKAVPAQEVVAPPPSPARALSSLAVSASAL
jgi:hypothetical protein